jgi:cytochrome c oxidase subunit 4
MTMPSMKALTWTWIALLVLLAVTCGSAYVSLGSLNLWVNFGIATAKALLVGWIFMHLKRSSTLVRLFAAAAFVWLLILAGLSAADYVTRDRGASIEGLSHSRRDAQMTGDRAHTLIPVATKYALSRVM